MSEARSERPNLHAIFGLDARGSTAVQPEPEHAESHEPELLSSEGQHEVSLRAASVEPRLDVLPHVAHEEPDDRASAPWPMRAPNAIE